MQEPAKVLALDMARLEAERTRRNRFQSEQPGTAQGTVLNVQERVGPAPREGLRHDPASSASAAPSFPLADSVLQLQRRAGNAAVAGMIGSSAPPRPVQQQRQPGAPVVQRLTEAERLEVARVVALLTPATRVLGLLGFTVTGIAVGLRGSGNAGAGAGAGAGADAMVFVDPVRWEITGDIVPYAEVGLSVSAGGTGGIVIGLRLTPDRARTVGRSHESYAGGSLNVNLQLVLGAGAFISTGILSGDEGWAGFVISLGPEAGADASYSYAVSTVGTSEAAGERLRPIVQSAVQAIVDRATQTAAVVAGVSEAVGSLVASIFEILDPSTWDLSPYTPGEQESWRQFGAGMRNAIDRATLDRFLEDEGRGTTVSSRLRIGQEGGVLSILGVVEAINRLDTDRRSRAGQPPRSPRLIEPDYFTRHTYSEFLGFARENRLLTTRRVRMPARTGSR